MFNLTKYLDAGPMECDRCRRMGRTRCELAAEPCLERELQIR